MLPPTTPTDHCNPQAPNKHASHSTGPTLCRRHIFRHPRYGPQHSQPCQRSHLPRRTEHPSHRTATSSPTSRRRTHISHEPPANSRGPVHDRRIRHAHDHRHLSTAVSHLQSRHRINRPSHHHILHIPHPHLHHAPMKTGKVPIPRGSPTIPI